MPIDYSKSLIYKLCCNDFNINDIYIGSTINFINRKSKHKFSCNNENNNNYNYKVYRFIRNNGGWDNWDMVLIENNLNVNNKLELHSKERQYIEKLKPSLNCSIPTRTKKEYYEDNKEVLLEKKKEYYNDNKEIINEKYKEWYNDNKEVIKQRQKEYRQKNKYVISEKNKIKMTCDCGTVVRKSDFARHKKTKKHIEYLNNKNDEETNILNTINQM